MEGALMVEDTRDRRLLFVWIVILLAFGILVNIFAVAQVRAEPSCVVTDRNPCSSPRGPWGR